MIVRGVILRCFQQFVNYKGSQGKKILKIRSLQMRNLCYNNRAFGGVAQLGERTVRIRKVKGSNPSVSTKTADSSQRFLCL